MDTVLIIDKDKAFTEYLADLLRLDDYHVISFSTLNETLALITHHDIQIILLDIDYPGINGVQWIEKVKELDRSINIYVISAQPNAELAAACIKKGAVDYFSKPVDFNKLLSAIRTKSHSNDLKNRIKKKIENKVELAEIIGVSDAIVKIKKMIEIVAPTDARVLITGKNGVGKELIAKSIHENSLRSQGPMVEVNCAAIPSELIESELFGHEKGAFTSALKQHSGKFEQANGGTLFLDEIGDMSLSAQAKVLRVLQERKITRVGADRSIPVDVRVIAATNKDLIKECNANHFRIDLYHRIAVIIIKVPALNERQEDIPFLIDYFLNLIAKDYGWPQKHIEHQAVLALQQHFWSGNIRELKNVVERLLILSGEEITLADVLNFVSTEFNLERV